MCHRDDHFPNAVIASDRFRLIRGGHIVALILISLKLRRLSRGLMRQFLELKLSS